MRSPGLTNWDSPLILRVDITKKHSATLTEINRRSISTAIYFLLESGDKSRFHKIDSSEVWHFYDGGCLQIVELDVEGNTHVTLLGKDVDKGEMLQYVVPPDRWFGAITAPGTEYSLVGCTVAPGFVFETLAPGRT